MRNDRREQDQVARIQSEDVDLPPELEVCLEALLPEHDPRAVYRAMREAMDELYRSQRRALH